MNGDSLTWRQRVDAFWDALDDADADAAIERMRVLVEERPVTDAEALFEWASVHDSVGRERDAVTHYRAALDAGLSGSLKAQALIQLASSLRNIGAIEESLRILQSAEADASVGDSAAAFLALALHDSGRHADALRVALTALAPTLPQYRRSVAAYADALGSEAATERIRPIAVGLVVRDGHALVEVYPATASRPEFLRALGGGIDFGERSEAAVRREFVEEVGITISDAHLLGISENIFAHRAERKHEIVYAFAVTSPGFDSWQLDDVRPIADSHTFAQWVPLAQLSSEGPELYPAGMLNLVLSLGCDDAHDLTRSEL